MQGWDYGSVNDVNRAFVPESSKPRNHADVFNSSLSVSCDCFTSRSRCRKTENGSCRVGIGAGVADIEDRHGFAAAVLAEVRCFDNRRRQRISERSMAGEAEQ